MNVHRRRVAAGPATTSCPPRRRLTGVAVALMLASGCATFPGSTAPFTGAPTLTPHIATVIPPSELPAGASGPSSTSGANETPGEAGGPTGSVRTAAPDPCAPPEAPVIAVCLTQPWGLAPLPDGTSALVGERLSGRILKVEAGQRPTLVATVRGLDTSHGGGLLGIALSPYYAEDGLVYAYVTTPTDARVLRIAAGQEPTAVVTGLPVGGAALGGSLLFDANGLLYIAVGGAPATSGGSANTTRPTTTTAPVTGSGSLWRVDEFGRPATQNASATARFADGFEDPTGLCVLPDDRVAVVDHRLTGDTVIAAADGHDYGTLAPGDAIWTYPLGDGGATDCAVAAGALVATAHGAPHLTSLTLRPEGGFSGAPEKLLDGEYGLLRTAVAGPGGLVWLTTANKAANVAGRKPDPSDDRVIVLPPSSDSGGGGLQ